MGSPPLDAMLEVLYVRAGDAAWETSPFLFQIGQINRVKWVGNS